MPEPLPDFADANLSQRLIRALSTRGFRHELMSLYVVDHDAEEGSRVAKRSVMLTARAWLAFVQELQNRLAASANLEKDAESARCTVGLMCAETFHSSVVESACLCLGETFCVFNPYDPSQRRESLLRKQKPRILLSDSDVASMIERAVTTASHEGHGCGDTLHEVERLVSSVPDSSLAYYIYTSGSTGEPKCVAVTRGNLLAYATEFAHTSLGLDAGGPACILCLSTPVFDPSIGDMVSTLLNASGGVLRCVTRESLLNGDLPQLLLAAAPTHIVSTPTVWRSLSSVAHALTGLNPKVKVFLGGESMPQCVIDHWAGRVELHNIYGVTEATVYQSVERVLQGVLSKDISCGVGGAGATLTLERFDSSDAVEDVELEVVIRGRQVCAGYAGAAASDQGGFVLDGSGERCFRTGDIGVWSEGDRGAPRRIFLRGRRDWQVKVNGQRTSLEEIEQTIQSVCRGAVRECCCCTVCSESPDSQSDAPTAENYEGLAEPQRQQKRTVIGAGCVLAGCMSTTARLRELRESLTEVFKVLLKLYLPTHMIPQRWVFFSDGNRLPQTPSGKTDRRALAREMGRGGCAEGRQGVGGFEGSHAVPNAESPEDQLSVLVLNAWMTYFGVAGVTPSANFFHLGGDSLGALRLTRSVFVAVQGSDEGIDAYGGLPPPFQPFVLITNPTLGGYTRALREAMRRDEHFAAKAGLLASPGVPLAEGPASAEGRVDVTPQHAPQAFLDVISTGSVALAEALLRNHLYDANGGNCRDHRCTTPLHVAARLPGAAESGVTPSPCAAMIRMLLSAGAKPTCVTADGVTPVHLAAASSSEALLTLLAHAPATVHCRDNRQQSVLHFAAREGQCDCVRLLLRRFRADLSVRDKWQRTAAHWAVLNGHAEVLATMLAHTQEGAHPVVGGGGENAEERCPDVGSQMGETSSGVVKRPRRGEGRSRLERLAKKKTHLGYESLEELAQRAHPEDARIRSLAKQLSVVMDV